MQYSVYLQESSVCWIFVKGPGLTRVSIMADRQYCNKLYQRGYDEDQEDVDLQALCLPPKSSGGENDSCSTRTQDDYSGGYTSHTSSPYSNPDEKSVRDQVLHGSAYASYEQQSPLRTERSEHDSRVFHQPRVNLSSYDCHGILGSAYNRRSRRPRSRYRASPDLTPDHAQGQGWAGPPWHSLDTNVVTDNSDMPMHHNQLLYSSPVTNPQGTTAYRWAPNVQHAQGSYDYQHTSETDLASSVRPPSRTINAQLLTMPIQSRTTHDVPPGSTRSAPWSTENTRQQDSTWESAFQHEYFMEPTQDIDPQGSTECVHREEMTSMPHNGPVARGDPMQVVEMPTMWDSQFLQSHNVFPSSVATVPSYPADPEFLLSFNDYTTYEQTGYVQEPQTDASLS